MLMIILLILLKNSAKSTKNLNFGVHAKMSYLPVEGIITDEAPTAG